MTNNKDRISPLLTLREALLLVCALIVMEVLLCAPINRIGIFQKFTAPEWSNSYYDFEKHEAFLKDHIGHEKIHLAILGSCELESSGCAHGVFATKCTIAKNLEDLFYQAGYRNIRVMNLAIAGAETSRNLYSFLTLLDDPSYKAFIWEDELYTNVSKQTNESIITHPYREVLENSDYDSHFFLPPIYQRLQDLSQKYPEMHEITRMLKRIELEHQQFSAVYSFDLNGPQRLGRPRLDFQQEFKSEWKILEPGNFLHAFDADFQNHLSDNTRFLRDIQRRLPELLEVKKIPADFSEIDRKTLLTKEANWHTKYYREIPWLHSEPPEIYNQDRILAFQLAARLAELYHKRLYLYFGPEGGLCQEDHVYTNYYKNIMLKASEGYSSVKIIDLTGVPLDWGVDTFTCVNTTYLGSQKVAMALFQYFTGPDKKYLLH